MCSVYLPTDTHLAPLYAFMFTTDSLSAVQSFMCCGSDGSLSLVCREGSESSPIDLHTRQSILYYVPI